MSIEKGAPLNPVDLTSIQVRVDQVTVIIFKNDGVYITQKKAYFQKWPILAKGRGEEDEI